MPAEKEMPKTHYLRLNRDDQKDYRHRIMQGQMATYDLDSCIGPIEVIEEHRKDLLPKIRNYFGDSRDTTPDPKDYSLAELGEKLPAIESPAIVREMMARDNRKGSQKLYLQRLDELEYPERYETEEDEEREPNENGDEDIEGEEEEE